MPAKTFDMPIHIFYSPRELGLSITPSAPTLEAVCQAMPDGSIGIYSINEVDDSALDNNGTVNVILLYKVSSVRMFAFGARSFANVNYANTRIFYAAHNANSGSWIGWKEFALDDFFKAGDSYTINANSRIQLAGAWTSRRTLVFTIPVDRRIVASSMTIAGGSITYRLTDGTATTVNINDIPSSSIVLQKDMTGICVQITFASDRISSDSAICVVQLNNGIVIGFA